MITVYRHRRLDTNEIFYVGIGKSKYRATNKSKRSEFWKRITNKTDYSVEIIAKVETWELACELEQFLIQEYGRKDLGTGTLVNMTDGGEGMFGHKHSEETKLKMSKVNRGKKFSKETKLKMSEAHKGKKMSEEAKSKMTLAKKGNTNKKGKTIICTETGNIWYTIGSCAIDNGLNKSTLRAMLNGQNPNKTTFKYLENEH